ncbi:MAG TPA: TetR family transcriptional regulator [Caulobacteraceae bacterium]|nr:TetR family transcriptional regulator [Caulobacteraceae bacterium]
MDKPAYHHGDLKSALITAAMAAVEQAGPDAVSLRDLAQSLGVSRAAPYRHFADRDALLAAVAAKGFEELIAVYENALSGPGDGRERLRRGLVDYLEFARRRPGLHALMFESDFLRRNPPPRVMIGPADRAYALLWEAVEGAFPGADPVWVRARTVTMLSTVIGYRVLDNVGRFKPHMVEPLTPADLLDAVLEAAIGEAPARSD